MKPTQYKPSNKCSMAEYDLLRQLESEGYVIMKLVDPKVDDLDFVKVLCLLQEISSEDPDVRELMSQVENMLELFERYEKAFD